MSFSLQKLCGHNQTHTKLSFFKEGWEGKRLHHSQNEERSKYYSKQSRWDLPRTKPRRSQPEPQQGSSPAHCWPPKAGTTELTQTACTACWVQGTDFCLLLRVYSQEVEYLKVKRACVLTGKKKGKQHSCCAQSDKASRFYHYNFFGNYREGEKDCLKTTIQRARKKEQEPR